MRTHEGEQPLLAIDPLAAGLGESRGDDDERSHPVSQRLLGRLDDTGCRHADDGHVDGVRDLVDRAVAAHSRNRRAVGLTG